MILGRGKAIVDKITTLVFLVCATALWGQVDTLSKVKDQSGVLTSVLVVDGDTIPFVVLDEVMLASKPTFTSREALIQYYYLRKMVRKVYPYAREAALRLDSINEATANLTNKREIRRYHKKYQKWLEERFEPELRAMTTVEGQILTKLIHRETGQTVYDIIKKYRSRRVAWFWALTARWYDISLRRPYDPAENEEDKLIESILRRGFINGTIYPAYPDLEPKY